MTKRPKLRTLSEKESGIKLPRVECRLTTEMLRRVKAEARSLEIPVAQWVRDCVIERLERST